MKIVLLAGVCLALVGCGSFAPCTYHGKAVSQREANHMRALGMDVKCPDQE